MMTGRPTAYREEFEEQVFKLAKSGMTDKQMADFFNVCESTFYNWLNEKQKFLESVKKGKDAFDSTNIEKSLKHRALGYTHDEEKVFCSNGEIITHTTKKHYPPDVGAIAFWLKNRAPERWKEKQDVEMDITSKGESINNIKDMSNEELAQRAKLVSKINKDK